MNTVPNFNVESWDHSKDWVNVYLEINDFDFSLKIKRSKYDSWLKFNNKLNVEPMVYKDDIEEKKVPQTLSYFDFQESFIKNDLEQYIKTYHIDELIEFDFKNKKECLDA